MTRAGHHRDVPALIVARAGKGRRVETAHRWLVQPWREEAGHREIAHRRRLELTTKMIYLVYIETHIKSVGDRYPLGPLRR
jgi:hypothetical protein